jgi:hypothetical protein
MTQGKQASVRWPATAIAALYTAALVIGWLFWWPLIQYSYHYWF